MTTTNNGKSNSVIVGILASCLFGCGGGASVPAPTQTGTPPTQGQAPTVGNSLPGPRPVVGPQAYVNFESGQVRPIALSHDGSSLFAANTPDGKLEIYTVGPSLIHVASVPVGIDPIAIAQDPAGRVWVVNHLSDSVSVVDVEATVPHVVQTLWVGDEPRDIVFAGAQRERAFITTAHRGQNSPVDPAFSTPGIGRADVWVFDSTTVGDTPGGEALQILTLFGDRPRPLAVSSDGLSVFAGIFLSGNRTTTIPPQSIQKATPTTSSDGIAQPDTGIIVKYNGRDWVDELGQSWNRNVPFQLPDYDVFEIDAVALTEQARYSGVGTTLFNIAVNPVDDTLYVSNLEARNHIRFSGLATRANTTLRGHVVDQRVSVIRNGMVQPRVLNKHIDFSLVNGSQQDRDLSLSTPLGMDVSADGELLAVTAFGSSKLALYPTAEMHDDTFSNSAQNQIELSGGGPSGVVIDDARNRAYVLTRFDNGISTIDLRSRQEIAHDLMFNPEPAEVRDGRAFLYDARITSGNGNDSCASCHIFGDTDALAWDVGEPDGSVSPITNVFIPISLPRNPKTFHPMKGPMTTQSMRGLRGHGPMHWRGDRSGTNRVGGETLEEAAFKEFNDAFDAFAALGRTISDQDMQKFTDFSMGITYPPNPVRSLDNQLRGIEIDGERLFQQGIVRVQTSLLEVCAQCHTLDPANGLYGTKGLSSDNSQPGERNFKIPHFRDQYQKVGMFGFGFQSPTASGPQIRGFSFNHNGATSSNFAVADLGMPAADLLAIRAFLYGFPTESAAVTGQAITLTSNNLTATTDRVGLLIWRAEVTDPIPECDLVANAVVSNVAQGLLYDGNGLFLPDNSGGASLTRAELEALLSGPDDRITLMCVPWGSGQRIAIDRDMDGVLNGDEI
jgi:DNA-binding beta-propeller fold protein YncE